MKTRGLKFRGPKLPAVPRDESRKKILATVKKIPRGSVASYGQVAFEAGLPGRARLVGKILSECSDKTVPWQRVINSQGLISLPKGSPSAIEQKIRLREEGITLRSGRVDMRKYGWRPRSSAPLLD